MTIDVRDMADLAIAQIPIFIDSMYRGWAARQIYSLLPLVFEASLRTEEGRETRCGLARLLVHPNENMWRMHSIEPARQIDGSTLAKMAVLSKPGRTYLVTIDGELGFDSTAPASISGIGQPLAFFRGDGEHALLFKKQSETSHFITSVAFIILGPGTIVVEAFGLELLLIQQGTPQVAPKATVRQIPWFSEQGDSQTARRLSDIAEDLVRGAWFSGKGAIFAFSKGGKIRAHTTDGTELTNAPSLLDLLFALEAERNNFGRKFFAGDLEASLDAVNRAQEEYDRAVALVIRAAKTDGAILLDARMRARIYGAKLTAKAAEETVPGGMGSEEFDTANHGTRHASAYAWTRRSRSRLALVVSQDRRTRAFAFDDVNGGNGICVVWDIRPRVFQSRG